MQIRSADPNHRRQSVGDMPPREVPQHWHALAFMAFTLIISMVTDESAVHHRRLAKPAEPTLIDINFGSEAELDSLPGIGPSLARAIIAARPFSTVDELSHVRGIGPKQAERLRPLIQAAQGRRAADRS